MRFKTLTVQNFFSYPNAEVNLEGQGLVLVTGEIIGKGSADSNGAGKSALFVDAIPWVLWGETLHEKIYGNTSRQFKADDVVNDAAAKDCMGQVTFSVGDHSYTVTRYRKHTKFGNGVFLHDQTLDQQLGDKAETQVKIDKLVGLNFTGFINSVVFGQGAMKRFSQCTDAERRKILDDFLQLETFTKCGVLVKKDSDANKFAIQDKEKEISRLDGEIDTIERTKDSLEEEFAEKQASYEELSGKQKEKVKQLKVEIAKENKNIAALSKDLIAWNRSSEETTARILPKTGRDKLNKRMDELNREIAKLSSETEHEDHLVEEARQKRDTYKIGDICQECQRPFENVVDLKTFQRYHDKQIKPAIARIEEKVAQLEKLTTESEEISSSVAADNDLREKLLSDNKEMSFVSRSLTQANERLHELQETLKGLEQININWGVMKEFYQAGIQRHGLELIDKQTAQQVAGIELESLKFDQRKFDFWYEGYMRQIKDFCFRKSLAYLNERLEYFAGEITKGDIAIRIKDDLTLEVLVKSGAKKYILASAGQEKRVDICVALALQSMAEDGYQRTNLSVFDEFDASLDKTGLEILIDFLQREASRKGTVVVISHNTHLQEVFHRIWRVQYQKDTGTSSLRTDG